MSKTTGYLRAGLIGYGFSGRTFHAPLIGAVQGIVLQAVASSDAAKVHADFPDMAVVADPLKLIAMDDIDLVVIATPNETHVPLATAAIKAGKAVVVDKPFAPRLAEAKQLVQLAAERNVLLSVFHNRRWDSDFLTIGDAIRSGAIGTVRHFEAHFDRFRPMVRDRWRERAGGGSGVWLDLGPHLVDQAVQLFGQPDTVLASIAAQRRGAKTDDWAHVVLSYGERRVILHAGMLVAGGTHRFLAHGDDGSLVKVAADRQERQLIDGMRPGDPGWGEDPDPLIILNGAGEERFVKARAGDQRQYYAGIVDALSNLGRNPVPPEEALIVMAIVEAAVDSCRSQRTVTFNDRSF